MYIEDTTNQLKCICNNIIEIQTNPINFLKVLKELKIWCSVFVYSILCTEHLCYLNQVVAAVPPPRSGVLIQHYVLDESNEFMVRSTSTAFRQCK